MRIGLALWCVSIAALIATLTPGWDRAWAVVPLLAIYGFWALLAPHSGSHTDRAGLSLASPAPSPAGSMILEDDREAWDARIQANLFPGPPRDGTVVFDAGAWEAGPMLDEPWAPYEAKGYKNPTAGSSPPAPAVADSAGPGLVSSSPGPAEPFRASEGPPPYHWVPIRQASEYTEIRIDLFAARLAARYDDTEFRAGMAADVLAYERDQTAGAWEYLARLADWADSYLREVRTAL
jgi:hypothetical protein